MATRKSDRIANRPVTFQSQHPLPSATQTRKSGAEGTRDWKVRLKTGNPEKYLNYMEYSKEYSREYRCNMTDSQRSVSNENAAARMRHMRQRKEEQLNEMTVQDEVSVMELFMAKLTFSGHIFV